MSKVRANLWEDSYICTLTESSNPAQRNLDNLQIITSRSWSQNKSLGLFWGLKKDCKYKLCLLWFPLSYYLSIKIEYSLYVTFWLGKTGRSFSRCCRWVWRATRKGCFWWHAEYHSETDGASHFLPTNTTPAFLLRGRRPALVKFLIRDWPRASWGGWSCGQRTFQWLFPSSVNFSPGALLCKAFFFILGECCFPNSIQALTLSQPCSYMDQFFFFSWTNS